MLTEIGTVILDIARYEHQVPQWIKLEVSLQNTWPFYYQSSHKSITYIASSRAAAAKGLQFLVQTEETTTICKEVLCWNFVVRLYTIGLEDEEGKLHY